jgi:hypothetical protein
MQKTAKKGEMGSLRKLREWGNVSGKLAEKFFDPKFKELMEFVRKKDDQIRTFVVGKKLGDAEIEPSGPALKDTLKQVKSNLNRREFMTAAHDLSVFHEQVKNIILEINSIDEKVESAHDEFLYEKLTPEQQERLKGLKTRFAQQQAALVKEAGLADIGDYFHNIGTSRGRLQSLWEKRYPKKVNEIKNGLTAIFQKSESLFDTIISSLKEMAAGRSVRNVDSYMKGASKITAAFASYDKQFKAFYNTVLHKYIAELEKYNVRQATQTATELGAQSPPVGSSPIVGPPVAGETPAGPVSAVDVVAPVTPVDNSTMGALSRLEKTRQEAEKRESAQKGIQPLPSQIPSEQIELARAQEAATPSPEPIKYRVATHQKFYSSLQSLSNESPMMLALFIKKYANSIKITDPNTSSKLFKIAQQIKG